jgi:hypothetical protein
MLCLLVAKIDRHRGRAFHACSKLAEGTKLDRKERLQGALSRMENYLRLNPQGNDVNFI